MQRRKAPKFEGSVNPGLKKDNFTYISMFPLQKSEAYLNQRSLFQNNRATQKINMNDSQLVDHVGKMLRQQQVEKNEINKYFASTITNPMVNNNSSAQFLDRYHLQQNQLVEVCQKKMFTLKSYYNYLQDEEVEKALKKIQDRNKNLQDAIRKQRQSIMKSESELMADPSSNLLTSKQQEQVLDPIHVKFNENIRSFNPKQRERMEISQRASQVRNYGW